MARRLAAVVLLAFGLVLAASPDASAHAYLTGSEPAAGTQLDRAPTTVVIMFNEAPDLALSVVHVLDTDGEASERGRPTAVAGQRNAIAVSVPRLSKGSYTVTWRTTSAVDGHTTGGAFAFGVQVPAVAMVGMETPDTPRPSPVGIAGRAAYYAGFLALIGAAVVQVRRGRRWRILAWLVGAAGGAAMFVDAIRTTGVGVTKLLSTTTGTKLLLELGAVALVGLAVVLSRRIAVVAITAALALLARAWAGHAAASSRPWLTVGTQWIHMLAVGVWIGGLPWLFLAIREGTASLRRFTRIATYALIVVAISGTARSLSEVRFWDGIDTSFGATLVVKLVMVGFLLALAAFNRFRARAASVASEALVALAVLGVTGVLTGLPPAATVVSNRPTTVEVEGNDFGTTMRARLVVSPGTAGPNRFVAKVSDYDTREPVAARAVTLRLTPADRADVAAAVVPLSRQGDEWTTDSAAMAIAGRWRLTVVVETSRGGTEIPLEISTRQPSQRIKAERSPGLPTFYTITIGARRIETYVDPGKRGKNEVHFTFYDSAGNEAETDLVGVTTRGRKLTSRKLSPGHYVADATLSKGTWRFEARTADGLRVHFSETIR